MNMHPDWLALADDLELIMAKTGGIWSHFRNGRIFLTGGTGFIGTWLTVSFLHANRVLGLGARLVVLSRDPAAFRTKVPFIADDSALTVVAGDVRTFEHPDGPFTHIIHAATDASAALNAEAPLTMVDTIVAGTRRVLEFAVAAGVSNVLFVSSGAVYGKQSPEVNQVREDYPGGPDPLSPHSAYHEGKRLAEQLCAIFGRKMGLNHVTIARCFAFVGPWLPLTSHFAIGNFLSNVLTKTPIVISGDGTTQRSYLYAADLAAWLWTIMISGRHLRPYNVGSSIGMTMAQTANIIATASEPASSVQILGRPTLGIAPDRYVPCVERAKQELGLDAWTPFPQAVYKTLAWYKQCVTLRERE